MKNNTKYPICAVAPDKTIFTIFENGNLEIRGKNWKNRIKQRKTEDQFRLCKLTNPEATKEISEKITELSCNPKKIKFKLIWL